jgi:hypothetical protein
MVRIGLKLKEVMAGRNPREGAALASNVLREAVASGKVRREDISLRELAQSLIGDEWAAHLKSYNNRIRESVDAVDASGFSAITGQLMVDEAKEKYKLATLVTDALVRTIPVTNGNLGTQIVPYLSDVVDDPGIVQQGQPYPATGFTGQYVTLAAPEKYGRICRVTFEMIFADLTKQALDSAGSVGRRVGLWVEEKRLRVILGLDNNYVWNGTSYNTYLTSGGWINSLTSFSLTDWTSIQTLELLQAAMMDPVTSKPIEIESTQMLVNPALNYTAKRILNATEVRSGNITSGVGTQTVTANPLDTQYSLFVSKHMRNQALTYGAGTFSSASRADSIVIFGDLKKAFYWREVFPAQVVQAPPQAPAEFNEDVVVQVKTNVFGVAGVYDPRFAVRAYNNA